MYNLKLRRSYAVAHPFCECGQFFPDHFDALRSTESHHVMTGRVDNVTNLVRVSSQAHGWLEANKTDGRIVCIRLKHDKGELDPEEFYRAGRIYLPGWLARATARNLWCVGLLEELRELYP